MFEREDVYELDSPEISLNKVERMRILNQIYLYHYIDLNKIEHDYNIKVVRIKEYIRFLIQSMIFRGYYKGNVFLVSNFYKYPIVITSRLNSYNKSLLGILSTFQSVSTTDIANVLHISKEDFIRRHLNLLISDGLIIGKLQKTILHIQWVWKPSDSLSLRDEHFYLVGTAMMLRRAKIGKIAQLLEKEKEEIFYLLGEVLLYRRIEGVIFFETRFLGDNDLIVYIERFLYKPEKKSISALNLEQKQAIGYIMLAKQIKIKTLSRFLGKKTSDIVKLLADLTAKGTFQTIFTTNSHIQSITLLQSRPTRTIEELSTLSFFNYEALLGILATKTKVSIKKLANEMKRSEEEIIEALINLLLEGFLSCSLRKSKIIVENIHRYSRAQEGSLERWEKIILGMIIAKVIISTTDISKALGINKVAAKQYLFGFYGKGLIKGRLAANKLIPDEIPVFPPLNQLFDFPTYYMEIYGYLVANGELNIKDAMKIWKKRSIAVKNIIYELTGSGLINVDEKGSKFILLSSQKFFPSTQINELGPEYVQVINEIEKSRRDKVKLYKISEKVRLPPLDVFKIICQLIAQGYYKGRINQKYYLKIGKLILPSRKLKCYYCGREIQSVHNPCPNCGKLQPLCSVCNGPIHHGQEVLVCPTCGNSAHKEHMLKWLSIKPECPVCKTHLTKRNLKEERA